MMPVTAKAIMALGLCLVASQAIAQQGPPPVQPQQPPPPPQQPPPPPPGPNNDDRTPRDPDAEEAEGQQRLPWYNGDYSAGLIAPVMTIDDPVIGFGNEALWTSPAPLADPGQSDVARPGDPD